MSTDHPDRDVNAEDQPITEISKADESETVKPEAVKSEDGDLAVAPVEKPPRRLTMLIAIAAVILLSDILTKVWAVAAVKPGQPIEIIGDVVTFTMVRNPGGSVLDGDVDDVDPHSRRNRCGHRCDQDRSHAPFTVVGARSRPRSRRRAG